MDVTIAVSAKNAEKIIPECLKSIKNQSVKPAEILVVVDADDDSTIPVAKEHGARVLINKKGKLYNARNTALENCRTDILAFTDADCVLGRDWIKNVIRVFEEHPDVAAGTGPHPMIGGHNFASWLHHMWYVVETQNTGFVDGVIGGNSYFRTGSLREVGGWIPLSLMAAEDVHISKKILDAGHKIWFDERIVANHRYKAEFWGLMRQLRMSGHDIVVMMREAGFKHWMWWFTLLLPLVALGGLISIVLLLFKPIWGLSIGLFVFGGSLLYYAKRFNSLRKAFPRWFARWILIWPYCIGVIRGLVE